MTQGTMLGPGLHSGVPMREYLALDAIGSTQIEWLGVSPLHFKFMQGQPHHETAATELGTALHLMVLEPERFHRTYAAEPDPESIAPDAAKPRATKAYREAVGAIEASGFKVLDRETMQKVADMAGSISRHKHAAALLGKATEREVTALWERDGILCRGRMDGLGVGVVADIKTTRRLKDFSPWTITKLGYYRQAGWYSDGLARLGHELEQFMFIAVENTPPHDVGVFALDQATIGVGRVECDMLWNRMLKCRESGEWQGMYPGIQQAMLSDAIALDLMAGEEE